MGPAIGEMLTFAIGVAISPIPIVGVILMLFSARARSNGPAFLLGWVLGAVVAGVIVLALAGGADVDTSDDASTVASVIKLLLGLGLLALAAREWRARPKAGEEPPIPKWMQAIDAFTPVKAIGLAVLLCAVNPKNLALIIGGAVSIAQAGLSTGETALTYALFVIIASLGIAVPVIYFLVGGEHAQKTMEGWKAWLLHNNATVMAVLLLVFGVSLVGQGIGGVFD